LKRGISKKSTGIRNGRTEFVGHAGCFLAPERERSPANGMVIARAAMVADLQAIA